MRTSLPNLPTLLIGAALTLTGVAPVAAAAPAAADSAVQPTVVEQVPLATISTVVTTPSQASQPQARAAATAVHEFTREAPFSMAALTWTTTPPADMRVRAKQEDGTWGAWYALRSADASGDTSAPATSTDPAFVGRTHTVQVNTANADPAGVKLVVLAPDEQPTSVARARTAETGGVASSNAIVPPAIISRAGWGADERLHCSTPEYSSRVKAAVVHHTAEGNDYTPDQSAAIVRGIYAFHAQVQGWCDIGYNALVDKYGQVFEGAAGGLDRAVIGAHAGGFNTYTVGVAMLGTYTTIGPPEPQLDAVARYLAWQASIWGLDPHGSTRLTSGGGSYTQFPAGTVVTVPQILGHRDVDLTECPGNVGYTYLPNLRDRVARYLSVADLAVTVSIPPFLPVGQNLPISVRVVNNGAASSGPSDTRLLSLGIGTITDGDGGEVNGGNVTFHTPNLAPGQAAVYDLRLQTTPGFSIGGTFTNTVSSTPDANPANNWLLTLHGTW